MFTPNADSTLKPLPTSAVTSVPAEATTSVPAWMASVMAVPLLFGFATAASAHAHLKTAEPAANAVLTSAPQQLELHYTEGLELALSSLKVTGPTGTQVQAGPLALASNDDTELLVPINGAAAPGRYQVDWHVVAKDGHRTQGSYSFTVKP